MKILKNLILLVVALLFWNCPKKPEPNPCDGLANPTITEGFKIFDRNSKYFKPAVDYAGDSILLNIEVDTLMVDNSNYTFVANDSSASEYTWDMAGTTITTNTHIINYKLPQNFNGQRIFNLKTAKPKANDKCKELGFLNSSKKINVLSDDGAWMAGEFKIYESTSTSKKYQYEWFKIIQKSRYEYELSFNYIFPNNEKRYNLNPFREIMKFDLTRKGLTCKITNQTITDAISDSLNIRWTIEQPKTKGIHGFYIFDNYWRNFYGEIWFLNTSFFYNPFKFYFVKK